MKESENKFRVFKNEDSSLIVKIPADFIRLYAYQYGADNYYLTIDVVGVEKKLDFQIGKKIYKEIREWMKTLD